MNEHRPNRTALRVLCVDDDELILEGTVYSLTKDLDFHVVSFASPLEARAYLLGEGDIDVVISDVMMPHLSGPDFFLACSGELPDIASRFIFLSGDVVTARRLLNVALGQVQASDPPLLLQKPVSKETLLAAVAVTVARAPRQSGTFPVRKQASNSVSRDSSF